MQPRKFDLFDTHSRAFCDNEYQRDRGRGYLFDLDIDIRIGMAFFGQQLLNYFSSSISLHRVEWRIFAYTDVSVLKSRQRLAFSHRFETAVLNVAYDRIFPDFEYNNFASAGTVSDHQFGLQRIENTHIDDRFEIAPRSGFGI
jgi:hypothetical protein